MRAQRAGRDMTAVWSGLLGVIVGGLITTFWSSFAVVHQEIGNAMVSAGLVDEDLVKLADASRITGRPMIDVNITLGVNRVSEPGHCRAAAARLIRSA